MCGIFGIVGDKQAPTQVFKGLSDIEYRGYYSWGIAYFSGGKFKTEKIINDPETPQDER